MNEPTVLNQLGCFIISFQHVEAALTELLVLMSLMSDEDNVDDEMVRILVNELEFSKRVATTEVIFARFVDLRCKSEQAEKQEFHKLITEIKDLGTRRNDIVHSKYLTWISVDGVNGLLKRNSKLRGGKGIREIVEEELNSKTLQTDVEKLDSTLKNLESFRIKVINWLHPE